MGEDRIGIVHRTTKETDIYAKINLDGKGNYDIKCEIGFLKHMLETFARYSNFDIKLDISGDLHVDYHHTIEDTAIVLGRAIYEALGDKKGINRAGFFVFPMDDSLVLTAIDLSGRFKLVYDLKFQYPKIGDVSVDLFYDFFYAFGQEAKMNLHIKEFYGYSDHHKIEAVFKSLGKSFKYAVSYDATLGDNILSTKGVLV